MNKMTQQVIQQYYQALKSGDLSSFRLTDDFTFDGPIASFANPDGFRSMASQFSPLAKDIRILDGLYQDDKAFVILEFETNVPAIGSWIALDYFVLAGGMIKYSRTIYDPRKLLAFMQSQQP